MNNRPTKVYDKAKYHEGSCQEEGLSGDHSFMHTAVFMCWLAEKNLLDPELAKDCEDQILRIKSRTGSPIELYEWIDGCFFDDMVCPEIRGFVDSYFDFESGRFATDYSTYCAAGLKSIFHVPISWASYELMIPVIEARHRAFLGEKLNMPLPPRIVKPVTRPWWKFWA